MALLASASLMAQSEFDALKYSQTDINGTARYMSMGGAFGALGGDGSSILLNPAGLGVYRKSEMSISTGLYINSTSGDWNGESGSDNKFKVPFNNFTYVINLTNKDKKHGLVTSNFAFTFNKLKNFNRNISLVGGSTNVSQTDYMERFTDGLHYNNLKYTNRYEPFNNINVPWLSILAFESNLIGLTNPTDSTSWSSNLKDGELVKPSYSLSEEGYLNEWSFSYGVNISNIVNLGATLGIQSLDYSATSQYTENFGLGGGYTITNNISTEGTGVNGKFGAIVRPIDFIRIGASIATPTFFKLTDTYQASISSDMGSKYSSESKVNSSYYRLQGPVNYNFSLAFIIGKAGLVSADYGIADYSSMKLRDDNNISSGFSAENNAISNKLKASQTLRLGAEVKVAKGLSLRAGYANTSNATDANMAKNLPLNTIRTDTEYFLDKSTNYYSGGIGYREDGWFLDFAYQLKVQEQEFYAFNLANVTQANLTTKTNNFILSFGLRF